MPDFSTDFIRAQREMAAAATEIERQAARAEAAERERDALRDRLRWIPVEERLPEVSGQAGFTQMFGPGSIYAITPVSEEIARAFVARSIDDVIEALRED